MASIIIGETVTVSVERYNTLLRAEERMRIMETYSDEEFIDGKELRRICGGVASRQKKTMDAIERGEES